MKLLLMPLPLPLLLDSPPSTQYRSRLHEERRHGISDPKQIGAKGGSGAAGAQARGRPAMPTKGARSRREASGVVAGSL
jgi:hypothetical protein